MAGIEINWLAVTCAGIAGYLLGGLWYSPILFARAWQREVVISDEVLKAGGVMRTIVLPVAITWVSALVFAAFLGPKPGIAFATGAGFAAGAFWVAASLGVNYLFERKSLKLFLINGGYQTLEFTLIGFVLGWLG